MNYLPRRIKARSAPALITALFVAAGMAYSFFWMRLVQSGFYSRFWLTPGDLWSSFRTAHWIVWGGYGSLYGATGQYLTTPGLAIVLAPLAALTQALGLSTSFPLMIPHPTAWLILGPFEMLLACTALFAIDALAERLGASSARRRMLCVTEGVVLFPLVVVWGHPEDAIAFALTAYGLMAAFDGRFSRAGWLFGAAVAFQPLVLLALPIALSRALARQILPCLARAAVPSVVLLAVPFCSDWGDTWRAVIKQPTELAFAHVTPWTAIAPRMAGGFVSSGPTRLIAIAGSVLLGLYAAKRRPAEATILWLLGCCFALRVLSESALESYYIWPALAVFVLVAAVSHRPEVAAVIASLVLGVGVTLITADHFGTWWEWWIAAVAGLVLIATSSAGALPQKYPPKKDLLVPELFVARGQREVMTTSVNSGLGSGAERALEAVQ